MAVTQNTTLQAAVNGSGARIDTVDGTGGNTVRQLVCVGSPGTPGNYQEVDANNDAQVKATILDGKKASYRCIYSAVAIGTAATTNIFTIGGSATKTVRVTRIQASGTKATTADQYDAQLVVQSAADTLGTAVTATAKVPLDSTDAAATAVVKAYTAAPTAGTAVGGIATKRILIPVTGAEAVPAIWEFGNRAGCKAVKLSGTAQVLALTINGATPSAGASIWDFEVEWTEE